ncbi:MAG: 5'-methylthioadenosine/S-adenosylhomocysteine nucleosidase [Lachnospiraceae bacterium]|nr:5'-methylthioadenosine/S-adenosylhomocysteine nucleosidase [Lachnospiraceae bacterium]
MNILENVSNHRPILIQGAMENEIDVLIAALQNLEAVTIHGFEFYSGLVSDTPVVISRTHIGKINATMATLIGIENFHPSFVINQGTAGAHNINLNTGDIVLGKQIINMDAPDLDIKALLAGIDKKTSEPLNVELQKDGNWDWTYALSSSEELSSLFQSVPYSHGILYEGTIASGDGWTQTKEGVRKLHERYGSDCEEMESFAVAQVCEQSGLPYVVLRIISNSNLQGTTFDERTAGLCQNFVIDVLKNHPAMIQK